MCYRPVKISNPSRHYANDMPKYLYVPCGHCADCLRNKKTEWYFRCMIEYQDILSLNGCCVFVTLTYSPENLPSFTLPDGSVCQGFDKRHIHNFIKYFRIYLARQGIDSKGIKYLVCSEYGEHTKRPHYHGLLFIPFKIHWKLLQDVLNRSWHYGFVICSQLGWFIRSPSGLRYASKYIVKDMSYYNDVLKDYLSTAKTTQDRKELLEPYKDYLPNHWQSIGFGESFIYSHILHGSNPAKYLFDNRYNLNVGNNQNLKIPRYYHLKLEKQRNKSLSRCLGKVVLDRSAIGVDVEILKHTSRLDNEISNLRLLTLDYLNSKFPTYEVVKKIYERNVAKGLLPVPALASSRAFDIERSRTINGMLDLLGSLDICYLAIYKVYLRFYPYLLGENVLDFFNQIEAIIHDIIFQPAIQPEVQDMLLDKVAYVATPLADRTGDKFDMFRPCCEHPDLQQYEQFCQYYDFFNYCLSLEMEDVAIFKEKHKNHLSKHLKGNIY